MSADNFFPVRMGSIYLPRSKSFIPASDKLNEGVTIEYAVSCDAAVEMGKTATRQDRKLTIV